MVVRPAEVEDHEEWLSMRSALWPDCSAAEHLAEMRAYAGAGDRQMAIVVEMGSVCGFVEASLRLSAEGCTTTPVGYIEGIYVMPDKRHCGSVALSSTPLKRGPFPVAASKWLRTVFWRTCRVSAFTVTSATASQNAWSIFDGCFRSPPARLTELSERLPQSAVTRQPSCR